MVPTEGSDQGPGPLGELALTETAYWVALCSSGTFSVVPLMLEKTRVALGRSCMETCTSYVQFCQAEGPKGLDDVTDLDDTTRADQGILKN